MFFYPHWTVDPSVWWQWLFPATVLAVAAGLAWLARKNRGRWPHCCSSQERCSRCSDF